MRGAGGTMVCRPHYGAMIAGEESPFTLLGERRPAHEPSQIIADNNFTNLTERKMMSADVVW